MFAIHVAAETMMALFDISAATATPTQSIALDRIVPHPRETFSQLTGCSRRFSSRVRTINSSPRQLFPHSRNPPKTYYSHGNMDSRVLSFSSFRSSSNVKRDHLRVLSQVYPLLDSRFIVSSHWLHTRVHVNNRFEYGGYGVWRSERYSLTSVFQRFPSRQRSTLEQHTNELIPHP